MLVPVVLKDGHEELVSKDEFQYLLHKKEVLFFKRFAGWVVVGRDKMRSLKVPYNGVERRQHNVFMMYYGLGENNSTFIDKYT